MRFLYNSMRQKKLPVIILSLIIVLLLAVIGVLAWKYQSQKTATNETDANKETSQRIIQKISSLYFVPTNEEPTVALIQDKNKLGEQEFFNKAQNGDYLIIYQKDKVALIYREKDNKLVNVGPVNLEQSQQDKQTELQQEEQSQTAGEQTQREP